MDFGKWNDEHLASEMVRTMKTARLEDFLSEDRVDEGIAALARLLLRIQFERELTRRACCER